VRIAVVADRHLAPEAHAFNRNWAAAGAFVWASHQRPFADHQAPRSVRTNT